MTASPFSLHGKTILVTGATSGIGRAAADMVAGQGAKVVITGRDGARLAETLQGLLGEGHEAIRCDLSDDGDLDQLLTQLPEVDGVVFAAGIAETVPVRMIKPAHLNRVMAVNFSAPIYLTQGLLSRKKIRSHGSLVFVTAIAEHVSPIGSAVYSASKSALTAAVRTMSLELAKFHIRANCVSPGYVRTPMVEKLSKTTSVNDYVKLAPLGLIEPDEVAGSIGFLLSPASRWITRSTLVIDSGLSLPVR